MQNRIGRPAIPYVASSGLAAGKLRVPSATFEGPNFVMETPQTMVDAIIVPRNDGGALLHYLHNEDAFPRGFQERVLASLVDVLCALATETASSPLSSTRLAQVPLDDMQVITAANSCTRPLPDGLLGDDLFILAQERPIHPAVITPTQNFTYSQLLRQAQQVARTVLDAVELVPAERVAVMLLKGASMPVAVHAVLLAGGAYVPIDPALPLLRVSQICDDAAIRVALTSVELNGTLEWPESLVRIAVGVAASCWFD